MSTAVLEFHGTRGSVPVCDPKFQEFGGNTTCISVFNHQTQRIGILDAGTGIRALGKRIKQDFSDQRDIFITFTHFHWDHIQGLPFFDPAYDPEMELHILTLGIKRKFTGLRDIFATQMQEVYFPVTLDNMGCSFNFLEYNDNMAEQHGAIIRSIKQNHPGGSYGYRLENKNFTLVVCTDIEHGQEVSPEVVEFCRGADLLIHDAQYTSEELETRTGWGHSSYDQAIQVAERAEVGQLIMTHHDPDHDDQFLRKMEQSCQDRFKDCVLAREGMKIDI
jgi:phosphoribosyl 1,2-cyclic phosphodiesterase